ncbi:unnamed protein product, partial [Sphacelaria rigidula]
MVKEVIHTLRSILSEQRRPVSEWVDVLPDAQWALNTSSRERYRNPPHFVVFRRASRTAFSALVSVTGGEWNVDVMDADTLRDELRGVVDEQVRICNEVRAAVAVSRETKRKLAQGQAVLPRFAVGDFVSYVHVRGQGVTPNLMSAWTGPWRVVGSDNAHVYSVQNRRRTLGGCRSRFYADSQLHTTSELKDVFQHSYAQGECRMNASVHVAEDGNGDVIVLVDWDGVGAEGRTWEFLRKI